MTLPAAAAERRRRLEGAVDRVEVGLFRLARQGLVRASPSSVAELQALAQTAHNGGMIKVERSLAALATSVQHYLERDPNFRDTRYVDRLSRLVALTTDARAALERPGDPREFSDLLGESRRTYVPVDGVVHVQALAAVGWVTDSDFVGITVHLRAGDRFVTVSSARPAAYFGNDPRRLFRQPLSDAVDLTVEGVSHGAHVFENAKQSADGRLSIHSELVVRPAAWTGRVWRPLTATSWSDAVAIVREQLELGQEVAEGKVLLRPTRWGPLRLDEQQSVAHLEWFDGTGATVACHIAMRPENNQLIDNLSQLSDRQAKRPEGLFGRLTATAAGLTFEPWTAVYDAPVTLGGRRSLAVDEVHLGLEDIDRVQR